MITFDTNELELTGEGGLAFAFPLHETVGTADTAAVLFELVPGATLPTHTDSAEETLLVLAGEGEATVGEETARIAAGQVAVVPASVPHGVRNVGDVPLRVFGFFSGPTVLSFFEDPPGEGAPTVFVNGMPAELLSAAPAAA